MEQNSDVRCNFRLELGSNGSCNCNFRLVDVFVILDWNSALMIVVHVIVTSKWNSVLMIVVILDWNSALMIVVIVNFRLVVAIVISDWNSALMIVINGEEDDHLEMLEGGVMRQLLDDKWKTFAKVSHNLSCLSCIKRKTYSDQGHQYSQRLG